MGRFSTIEAAEIAAVKFAKHYPEFILSIFRVRGAVPFQFFFSAEQNGSIFIKKVKTL